MRLQWMVLVAIAGPLSFAGGRDPALPPCEETHGDYEVICAGCVDDGPLPVEDCLCEIEERRGGRATGTCTALSVHTICTLSQDKKYTSKTTVVVVDVEPCYKNYQCLGDNNQPQCDTVGNDCRFRQTGASDETGEVYDEQPTSRCEDKT